MDEPNASSSNILDLEGVNKGSDPEYQYRLAPNEFPKDLTGKPLNQKDQSREIIEETSS